MGNRKFGVEISQNRRVLGAINPKGGNPCAVNKRGLSQYVSLFIVYVFHIYSYSVDMLMLIYTILFDL